MAAVAQRPVDLPSSQQTSHTLPVTDELPTDSTLAQCDKVQVYDRDNNATSFRDLYHDTNGKVLIVFIRHFYCGVRPFTLATSCFHHRHRHHHTHTLTPLPALPTIHPHPLHRLPANIHIHIQHHVLLSKNNHNRPRLGHRPPLLHRHHILPLPHLHRPIAHSIHPARHARQHRHGPHAAAVPDTKHHEHHRE